MMMILMIQDGSHPVVLLVAEYCTAASGCQLRTFTDEPHLATLLTEEPELSELGVALFTSAHLPSERYVCGRQRLERYGSTGPVWAQSLPRAAAIRECGLDELGTEGLPKFQQALANHLQIPIPRVRSSRSSGRIKMRRAAPYMGRNDMPYDM